MRAIDESIVHCTATPEGRPVSVKEIDAWHRARGWSGCGYHRIIGLDGERLDGRPISKVGAHVSGQNERTIGTVYVGGVAKDGVTPKDTRTAAQKAALLDELHDQVTRFPIERVTGHNQYAAKACPSFDAGAEFRTFSLQPGTSAIVDRMLARGMTGADVRQWRADLTAYRKLIGHPYPVPAGDAFDHTVELVTIWFQQDRGIVADGKVGPQTRDEMELALAGKPPFQAIPENDTDDMAAAVEHLRKALVLLAP